MDIDLFGVFRGEKVDIDPATILNVPSESKKRKFANAVKSENNVSNQIKLVEAVDNIKVEAVFSTNKVPAKEYPFQLDTFQREAIGYIENNESVLVAAHTSAGKTAVAEYAIAKSLKEKKRVIYTSPIKALSNQKYRDLQEEFQDVGLMTGDMTINPNASCLIMTTEILRSMLYRGSEVIREVAWVIYDEVHYMRDKERGVVWEESIILLPHKVRFVFLSATIPNANEFVDWVSKIHRQPCHVVYTEYRPVPLQHFVFPAGSEGLFLVVDEKGKFRDDNFQRAMAILQGASSTTASDGDGDDKKKGNKRTQNSKTFQADLFKIVRLVMDRELDPCIVFSFSKKECEIYALQMSRLDFNNPDEKELVENVFSNAMESLSEDDQQLPQISTILPLLKRGIGIHHGGLLPILKEVIEILFQEGLIKCLFATETFSIGINMPAKTVVFTKTRKFDGKDFRWISSGEYIQMSGRAGRRGKDDKGIVIQMIDEKMEPDIAKDMIYGASDPLHSSYHVSYNMLLNMMRVEDADPENILKASFHQFQQEQAAPQLMTQSNEMLREAQSIIVEQESAVADYFLNSQELESVIKDMSTIAMHPNHVLPFLQPGRIVEFVLALSDPISSIRMGLVVNARRLNGNKGDHVVEIFYDKDVNITSTTVSTASTSSEIISLSSNCLRRVSGVRVKLPTDLTSTISKTKLSNTFRDVIRRLQGNLPILDPIVDFGMVSALYNELSVKHKELSATLASSSIHSDMTKDTLLQQYEAKFKLVEEAKKMKSTARESQAIAMKDTMRKMKRVLKKLQYISEDGVLGPKGRFACELTTADELVLTDMIFDGAFNELTPEQTVAVLSCFVHKEGQNNDKPEVKAEFNASFRLLQNTARNIARVCNEAKIVLDEEEYVKSFDTALMEVGYAWASGSKFVEVCRLTDIFEGSIIRSLRRLEELLRQLTSASAAIGNHELRDKFAAGADKIRRGVVFAASLYI